MTVDTAKTVGEAEAAKGRIRIYTTSWCPDCYRAKSFLKQRGVAFEEINIEETPGAADFVLNSNNGKRRVPTFEVDGRTFHCSPYDPGKLISELRLTSESLAR